MPNLGGGILGTPTARRTSGRHPPREQLERLPQVGPLLGMRDSTNPEVSKDPLRAQLIQNMYPMERDKPSAFIGVPGYEPAGAQGGAALKRTGQAIGQFLTDAGVKYVFRVIGGQGIQTYNFGTETWTTVVTVGNLTTNSITLSETHRVYWLKFNNKVFFSDGVNIPWTWDGQSGTAGTVSMTNCPVLYGQPTQYYAKILAIKNAARNRMLWSEELLENAGYEMAAYNNIWDVIQSSEGQLTALVGTNEALYVIRDKMMAAILGPVSKTFKTDGTRAGVSETVGSYSPSCVVYSEESKRLFVIDTKARPHIIQGPGSPLKEVWEDVRETLQSISKDQGDLEKAIGFYDQRTKLVCFAMVETGQSSPTAILVYNPVLDIPVAVWRGHFPIDAIAIVQDGDGNDVLMHLDDNGYAYLHGLPEGDLWDFESSTGASAIAHKVRGPHMGNSIDGEKTFSRVDLALRADGDASSITFLHETPYGRGDAQMTTVEGASARLDEFVLDTDVLANVTSQTHVAFGLGVTARWMVPELSHEVLGEQFGFEALSVGYTRAGNHPSAK